MGDMIPISYLLVSEDKWETGIMSPNFSSISVPDLVFACPGYTA